MTMSLRGHIRGLLRIRQERVRPRRGPKPAIGDFVVFGDYRMTVQAGLSDDLWKWLVEQGWRELTHRPERRHYRELPATCVTKLFDALEEERIGVLQDALTRAFCRPMLGDPSALPSYIARH